MVLGLALRALGPVLRGTALILAPVAAVLAWGAVENGLDRKNAPREVGAGVH
ncbi:hypothetical protein [Actinomycetospora sp. NBRC 106378]|jgi:hypothetical protein|uniref:hypothetical protein n=1 Tax=Actinomycetospora sp. NBRC 106378 TaxID=3032208 RepID=UPI002553A919|nr:hypothetical protein [Actinomycetospora sp. NBRC 106378]